LGIFLFLEAAKGTDALSGVQGGSLGIMGYILRRLTPPNRRNIFSAITKFSNFKFLLFQSFLRRL